MSIIISFSLKPKGTWLSGQGWNMEKMQEFSKGLAREQGFYCETAGDFVIYQFCPEGYLWMQWKNHQIQGSSQTNVAGPGFHAAVIYFLELYAVRGNMGLWVEDRTGYYEDRDFVRMRRDYFYQWYSDLMNQTVETAGRSGRQMICWPSDYYLPEEKEGMVVTHIRPFPVWEIEQIVRSGMSMAFAKDFFIWNEEEKDAYYYRNSGLVRMNQECYFMPSDRSQEDRTINEEILRLLEKALEMKPDIPFPKEEYVKLCNLAGKEPMNHNQAPELMKGAEIGCRKGLLFRTIGCMRFAVPGTYLYDNRQQGNGQRYYDGRNQNNHDYYICAVHMSGQADFYEASFEKKNIEQVLEFTKDGVKYKVAVYHPRELKEKMVFSMAAQVICKSQLTIISIHYDSREEQDWALDLVRKVCMA